MIIGKNRKWRNNSLKSRIILLAVISFCTIISAISISYGIILKYNRSEYDKWCSQKYNEIQNEFLQKITNIKGIITICNYNPNVQRVLEKSKAEVYELASPSDMESQVFRTLYNSANVNTDIYDIYLTNVYGDSYIYLYFSDDEELRNFIYKNKDITDEQISPIMTLGGEECFAMMNPIYSSNDVWKDGDYGTFSSKLLGHSAVVIKASFLRQLMDSIDSRNITAFLLDQKGNIMMQSENKTFYDQGLINSMKENFQKGKWNYKSYVLNSGKIYDNGWTMVIAGTKNERNLYKTKNIALVFGFVWIPILAILLTAVFHLLKNLENFVNKLTFHMEYIGKGDLTKKIEFDSITEFREIEYGLNDMMEKVVGLSSQNIELATKMYQQQKEQMQSMLLALQSQMNPHFLYNTMECIKNIGICYGIKEIEKITEAMADIFRYSLRKESVINIRDEIECVKNYMTIQSIRFEDRYHIQYEIDEQLLDLSILRLSLEPLVENSVVHGFEKKICDCQIIVRIYQDQDCIYMEVEDNGSGIGQEMISDIMHGTQNNGKNIALKNLIRRINIYYQNNADFTISSSQGQGTKVCVQVQKKFYDL